MSSEIYNRAMIREKTIWPSFLYGMPGAEAVKAIVFGLYANTYLLGHDYLEDIEAEELQRLVDVYDSNMAELDIDEQNLVLEIASKRYLKTIEIQIKNNALTTKAQQLNADEQEYQAKLAALKVDRQAVITKQQEVTLAIDRANNRIRILDAKIQLEGLAQKYVDVDIAYKELEESKAQLKLLYAGLKGLEIQMDILDTTYRITELEASKAGIKVETEMIKVRTEENKFSSSSETGDISERKLYLEEEDKNWLEYRVNTSDLHTRKEELVEEHENTLEDEKDHIKDLLIPKEAEIKTEQESIREAQHDARIQTFTDKETISDDFKTQNEQANDHKELIAVDEREHRSELSGMEDEIDPERSAAASTRKSAAIDAAQTMATANITSTLTHEIGSA